MKQLISLRSFDRDARRVHAQGRDIAKLNVFITALRSHTTLPSTARPHKLSGKWDGAWECHIGPDWLLIYSYTKTVLTLIRTGSHRDLFKN